MRLPHSLLRLLLVFLERKGELITRQQIAELLWEEPQTLDVSNGINTAVNRLRTALRDDSNRPTYIETVVGAGYRFICDVEWVEGSTSVDPGSSPAAIGVKPLLSIVQPTAPAESHPLVDTPVLPATAGTMTEVLVPEETVSGAETQPEIISASLPATRRWPPVLWLLAGLLFVVLLLALHVWRRLDHSVPTTAALLLRDPVVQVTENDENHPVTASSVSPDGRMLAYSDVRGLSIRSLERGGDTKIAFRADLEVDRIAWRRDEKTLLVSCRTMTGRPQIWEVSLTPRAPWLVQDDATDATPSWTGDALAFSRSGKSEVWVAADSGTKVRKLLTGRKGERFANLGWTANDNELFAEVQQAPGSQTEEKGAGTGSEAQRRASLFDAHSGKLVRQSVIPMLASVAVLGDSSLLCISPEEDNGRTASVLKIFPAEPQGTWNTNGRVLARLGTDDPSALSISKDGGVFAFSQKRRSPAVFWGDVTGHPAHLTNVHHLHHVAPENYPHAWSAGGDAIFFESNNLGPYAIYKQRIDGSPAELLARTPGMSTFPEMAPDGHWVIFEDISDNPTRHVQALYKVSVDGGNLEQLPTTGLVDSFACSRTAQGRCVVRVVDNGEFVYYDLDPTSGQGKELARSEWMSGLMGDWSVSSDGKQIVTVSHDPSRPAIHFLRLDPTDSVRPDLLIRAPGEPLEAEELVEGGAYYVQTKTGDERSLLLVDRFGAATTLLDEDHPIWGVPSRQGKVAFPSPTTNVNVWVGHLNSRHD